MSLANLIVQPGRAVLQADAGSYFPDGTIAALGPKLFACPEARCALSLCGGVRAGELHAALAKPQRGSVGRYYADMAQLATDMPNLLREATAATANIQDKTDACVTLIGYATELDRPIGMMMTNDAAWFDGAVEPYQWIMVENAIGGAEVLQDIGLTVADLSDPARFDIDRDSLKLIEAQRARPWGAWPTPDPSYAVAHRIGGWVDQAEVTSAGVTVKRLVEWPEDRAGERIAPN